MAETELLVRIATQDRASRNLQNLQSSIIRVVGAVASLAATFKAITFPIQQAVEFERSLREIQKTTNFTDEAIISLGNSLRRLSIETGIAATELAEIAASAGQLGLGNQGRDAILAFTDTIARFAVVADLAVDEAATSIARITNIFRIPIEQAERVSSAFNELSNTTTATAEQLIDVVRRVGDASGLLQFEDALAIAAQTLELGQTAEVAGTAITKTFANMSTSAEDFAAVTGQSVDDFVRDLQTDAVGALRDVAEAIAELGTVEQGQLISSLFGQGRQFSFGAKLVQDAANDFRILDRTIRNATVGYQEATSSIQEYERISNSAARQGEILGAQVQELGIQFGEVLLPVLREVIEDLQEFLADPAVQARIVTFAEALADGARALVDWVQGLAAAEESFSTFFTVIKAFVAIGLGQTLLGIIGRVVVLGAQLGILGRVAAGTAGSWAGLRSAISQVAQGASLAEVQLARAGGTLGQRVAASVRSVNTLTSQQIALQQRRNDLERQYRILRIQIVREARQQALDAGQSFAAAARRGAAVRDAVNQGFAQRGADQTRIRGLQQSLRAVDTQLATTARTATVARRAFAGFGAIIRSVGLVLVRFVTGPLGILTTIFGFTLLPLIRDFFSGLSEETSRAGAEAIAQARAQAAETEAAISAFKEAVSQNPELQNIEITADTEQFTRQMQQAVSTLVQFAEASRGAKAEQDRLISALTIQRNRLNEANEELEQQEEIRDRLERRAQRSRGLTGNEQANLDAAIQRIEQLNRIVAAVSSQIDNTSDEITRVGSVGSEFAQNAELQIASIASILTAQDLTTISLLRNLNRVEEAISDTQERIVDLRTEQAELDTQGDLEGANRIAVQIDDSTVSLANLQSQLSATQDALEQTGDSARRQFLAPIINGIAEIEDQDLASSIIDRASRQEALGTADAYEQLTRQLVDAAARAEVFAAQQEIFSQLAERVENTASGIKGLFDNLETSTRAARQRVVQLGIDLEETVRDREVNLRIRQVNQLGEGGFLDRQIARVEESYEEQIAAIDSSTAAGQRRIRGLEQERDLRLTILRTQQQNNETQQEAAQLERDRLSAIKTFDNLIKEQARVREEIAGLEGESDTDSVRQRDVAIQRAIELANAISEARDRVVELTRAQAEFQGLIELDPSLPGAFDSQRFAVTEDVIENAERQADEVTTRASQALAALTRDAKQASDENTKIAGTLNSVVQEAQRAAEEFNRIAGLLGISSEQAAGFRESISGIIPEVRNLADATEEIFRSLAVDEIPINLPNADDLEEQIQNVVPEIRDLFDTFYATSADGTRQGITDGLAQAVNDVLGGGDTSAFPIRADSGVVRSSIQESINESPFTIQLSAELQSLAVNAQRNAAGGHVRGPGTGTSDSILSWISNGEYIMDALTTRFFGPGFFSSLQSLARSGNRFALPRFAGGGMVAEGAGGGGLSQIASLLERTPELLDEVNVNLTAGGGTFQLRGSREQVDGLTRALRDMSRGGIRE